jgi:hypothetical protein
VLIVCPWEFVHFVKSEYTWRASSVVLLWGFPGFEDAIDGCWYTKDFSREPGWSRCTLRGDPLQKAVPGSARAMEASRRMRVMAVCTGRINAGNGR